MEPQDYNYCYDMKKKCKKNNCLGLIASILSIAFFFVLGLIVGTVVAETIFAALSAVIVLAVVLGLLLVLTIIALICKKQRHCYNC